MRHLHLFLLLVACSADSGPREPVRDATSGSGLECEPLDAADCDAFYDVLTDCQGLIPSACPWLEGCQPLPGERPECGGVVYCCEGP